MDEIIKLPVAKPVIPGPEQLLWYWHPDRIGAGSAPEWFKTKLAEIDQDLTVTWSPIHERWLVWNRNYKVQSKWCSGWTLLFPVRDQDGSYLPLDERVLARIYAASVHTWSNAKKYFDAIEREWERDREKAKENRADDVKHSAGEYYDYMKIKSYGHGSKFANHWS
jgi:hypothetical protein